MASEIPFIDIPLNNLYVTGYLMPQEENAEDLLYRTPLSIRPQWEDKWYIVQTNDELDALAQQFYGHVANEAHALWWVLAEANGIVDPLDISFMEGYYMLVPDYFRVQNMIKAAQDGNVPLAEDSEISNYFQILDNPPVPLNPPDEPTNQPGGNEDNLQEVDKWLFLKRPNGGGYVLVTADKYGAIISEKANPQDYLNPVIFQPKP